MTSDMAALLRWLLPVILAIPSLAANKFDIRAPGAKGGRPTGDTATMQNAPAPSGPDSEIIFGNRSKLDGMKFPTVPGVKESIVTTNLDTLLQTP